MIYALKIGVYIFLQIVALLSNWTYQSFEEIWLNFQFLTKCILVEIGRFNLNIFKKIFREKISRFFRNLQNKWSFYPEGEAKQKFINKTMCENISLKNYPICGFVISDAKCCTGHQPKWFFLQNVCWLIHFRQHDVHHFPGLLLCLRISWRIHCPQRCQRLVLGTHWFKSCSQNQIKQCVQGWTIFPWRLCSTSQFCCFI